MGKEWQVRREFPYLLTFKVSSTRTETLLQGIEGNDLGSLSGKEMMGHTGWQLGLNDMAGPCFKR